MLLFREVAKISRARRLSIVSGSCLRHLSNGECEYASACKKSRRPCLRHGGRTIDRRRDVLDYFSASQRHARLCSADRQSLRLLPSESGGRRQAQGGRRKIQREWPQAVTAIRLTPRSTACLLSIE